MTISRRPLLLTAFTLLVCSACDLFAPSGEPYSGPLNFFLHEGHVVDAPPPPHIGLIVTTEKEYPCAGFQVEGSFRTSGSELRVTFSGQVRQLGEACVTMIAPAQYRVALPVTNGIYTLVFTRDGVQDRYTLTVTDTAMELVPIDFTYFTHPTATSFPRGN